MPLLYNSLKTIDDEKLITELVRRGYKIDSLRENDETLPPTGEIVKIAT